MKKVLALTFAFLLCAQPAFAALSVGATVSTKQQVAAADPWTWTHTTDAGTDLLVIACGISNNVADILDTTFNSVTMSVFDSDTSTTNGVVKVFYLVAPDIGATLNVSNDMNGTEDGACFAINFSGADQVTPLSGVQKQASNAGTSSSLSVTCPAGSIAVDMGTHVTVEATTAGGSPTSVLNTDDGANQYFGSYEDGPNPTMSWSWTTSGGMAHIAFCVNAAASATRRPVAPIIFQ